MIEALRIIALFAAVSAAALTAPLWAMQRESRAAVQTPSPIPDLKGRLP